MPRFPRRRRSSRATDGVTSGPLSERNLKLSLYVKELLEAKADTVPFHDWAHTEFVRDKAVEFACKRGAEAELVEAAALVHDLNYLVARNSPPSAGRENRQELLELCGFPAPDRERIEHIVERAHTAHRRRKVDPETACLSDADTLYKALPITPVLYAHRYLTENGISLSALARKIVDEQVHKFDANFYFYDRSLQRRYRRWAQANLGLWKEIDRAMADPAVASLAAKGTSPEPVG